MLAHSADLDTKEGKDVPAFDLPRRLRQNRESGPVAQLGARFHGMEEVIGSIPIRSTKQPFTNQADTGSGLTPSPGRLVSFGVKR